MTRLCLPHTPRRRATSSTSARSPGARPTRTAPSTSPRSSPCAASRTRCARTCSAARSASRRSTPGLVETDFSRRPLPRRRGEGEVRSTQGVEAADARRRRRLRPLRGHAAAARERRRDRASRRSPSRRGARILREPDGDADDPRRLDVLHLRRARRHRAARRAASSPRTRASSRASAHDQRPAAAAALVGQGRVLLGRVLPAQPARGRAAAGRALDRARRASSATAMQDADRGPERVDGAGRVRARRSSSAPTSRTSSRSRTTTSRSATRCTRSRCRRRRRPSCDDERQPVRARGQRRASRADAGDPLAARRGRTARRRRGRSSSSRASAGSSSSTSSPSLDGDARAPRTAERRFGDELARVRDSLAAWQLRVPQLRASWDALEPRVRPVGRRPRRAADARATAASASCRRPGCRGS